MSTTPETSDSFSPDRPLDVSVGTVRRLLDMAYRHYLEAARINSEPILDYWDGYIRACKHILEAEGQ